MLHRGGQRRPASPGEVEGAWASGERRRPPGEGGTVTCHALLFELDSIQAYLFASGRLRDVSGASELLDRLTSAEADDNLLDAVCRALDLEVVEGQPVDAQVAFSRRAGGAFYAFSEDPEALERLRALWTLAVQLATPHLGYTLGSGEGADAGAAFRAARQAMRKDASRQRPALPAAAPVAERARRTGLPAVEFGRHRKDGPIDAATRQRKRFADLARSTFLDRFAPQGAGLGWRGWPRDLESMDDGSQGLFPFRGDARVLALVHADGNGLGQILRRLDGAARVHPTRFLPLYTAFSSLVDEVTTAASRAATEEVLLPAREREGTTCLPARPILLGGDDITLLVRADLALDHVRCFARAFEEASGQALTRLAETHKVEGLPERLTLGVGLVFLRASQPFHLAIRLAESLTKIAKQAARERNKDAPASSIAFHRVTSTLVDDYDQLVDHTLTHRHGDDTFVDTLGAYFLDDRETPRLDDLLALADLLGAEDMARGPTRTLLTLMGHSMGEAEARYRRWRQVMEHKRPRRLEHFDTLLKRLTGSTLDDRLPYAAANNRHWQSPLGDAFALLGAGHRARTGGTTQDAEEDAA